MRLKSLELLLRTENRSRLYLVQHCWEGKKVFCIRCENRKNYRLADKRYRCSNCGYTFHDFTGRWIGQLNLSSRQWLWALKLFELEVPMRRLTGEIGISYPTALKAGNLIRCAIAQNAHDLLPKNDAETHQIYAACCNKAARRRPTRENSPIFGVSRHRGQVELALVREVDAKALRYENVATIQRGSIVYTGRFREYDALIFWDGISKGAGQEKKPRGQLDEEFWSFLNRRVGRFQGSPIRRFPLYLIELAFRYNHRNDQLFETLAHYTTRLVPDDLKSCF
ncbi:MAG TPA: transposase [Terriglobales bacterium]|jgi:transposase|nr:transposase [Terriglobales bacterium]